MQAINLIRTTCRNCDVEDRIGRDFGDGGKFVCGIEAIPSQPDCLVYSVGSNLDTSFEQAVRARTQCEIHTFDPTIDVRALAAVSAQYNFKVHAVGLGEVAKPFAKGEVKPLSSIMQELGHTNRTLTILKVDCEECEYAAFKSIFDDCAAGKVRIGQLQIELHIHNSPYKLVQEFFEGADKCGLMTFHKERNHWGCYGASCVEFAMITKSAAWAAFKTLHC